ncbi:unnamed protein product [Echinostoma caproni]|uniref:Fibronectin type-III domain-containing protein n=1 Tax=Echinostoma caproni TaxID=27848 RepID=A0A183A804_9TREM|nr:unnamed protein product [Echinostoma caproni]
MNWILICVLFASDSIVVTIGKVPPVQPVSTEGPAGLLGPPRQLSLVIACEPARPCITATWLPPLLGSPEHPGQPAEKQNVWNQLVAYRVRYLIVAAIDPIHQSSQEWPQKDLPFLRMVEKNITRLQFTTTAGEHLFGVGYEFRVAAVGKNIISPEVTERILIPEAAPSDAPIDFRVATGDETSVHLTWKPPHFQYRNGRITQYQVRCYVLGEEESTEKLRRVTETELIIADLVSATHACLAIHGKFTEKCTYVTRYLTSHQPARKSMSKLRADHRAIANNVNKPPRRG